MNANPVRKFSRLGSRTRFLLSAGTALPLALLAAPAQAACTVEGDTTTCTGELSTGVGTSTPNVVVSDLTANITPPAGFSAIFMGDVAQADIDTGDYTLNVKGAGAVVADSANPVELNFTGTINVTGLDPANNASSGIMAFAYRNGGSDARVNSAGNITIDISQDANSATWGNRAIVALAGLEEAAVTSTGDLSITVAGEQQTLVKGIEVSGEAGASIVNAGNVTVSAESGYGDGLAVISGATSSVESVGDIDVDFGATAGYGISAHGTHNTISSQGDITADGGGIVAQGKLIYDQNGNVVDTAVAEVTEVASIGDITVSEDGAGAIVALGNDVTVSSTGDLTTSGDLSSGIIAMRDYGVDPNTGDVYFDDAAQSVSVTSEGNITTAGDGSLGIAAGGGAGTASVSSVGDITTSGEFGVGIAAAGQEVTIASDGAITTAGDYGHGIIVAGDFAMVGEDPETMAAVAGDIAIAAGDITTSGMAAMGIRALSSGGNVVVTANSVATSGEDDGEGNFAEGIFAESYSGSASVDVGSASAEGFAASAAVALGGAGAQITAGMASVAGQHAAALYASSANGAASVDAGTVTLRGDQQAGVNALAYGGAATVTVASVVGEGTLGNGVYAEGTGGVSVTSGTIDVQRSGIVAIGLNDSDVAIETSGDTITETNHAIYGSGGNVSVVTAEGTITRGGTSGIRAVASDSAAIVNGGTAVATGDLGSAIHVTAPGEVSIASEAVQVTGPGADPGVRADGSGYRIEQGGIIVEGGAGAIEIAAGSVDVEGQYRYGISARGSGAIDIAAEDVTLASADSVAVVARGAAGNVTITTGTVTTTGASGVGVFADSTSGNISIDAGTTRVENTGMAGQFTGDAVVATSVSGAISINSENAYSAGYGGSAVVGISAGDVTINSGTARTTGYGPIGVYGRSTAGDAVISANETFMSGDDSVAVWARADDGDATANVGTVSATGALGDGVRAQANAGTATIAASGNVASAHGYGLRGEGADVSITTAAGALTEGAEHAIVAVATNSATIVNGGTAVATGDLGSAIHVTAAGPVSITSDGVEVTGAGAWPGERSDGSGLRLEQGGIIVEGGAGAIAIDADTVDIEGEHRYGISARGAGAISIAVDSVNLASPDAAAVAARGTEGDVSIATGTIVTTGASGTGIVAETTSGNITVDAGTTRIESAGMAGPFTGEGIYARSGTGAVTVNAADTYNAAYGGSAVVAISGGDVTVDSGVASTTGDGGVALLAQSSNGTLNFTSDTVTTTGADTRAIAAHAFNGVANVAVGDVTALGTNASGVLTSGREVNLTTDGDVRSTQIAVNVAAQGGRSEVVVNGSVASISGVGLVNASQDGVVTVSEGASVTGGTSGAVLIGGLQGGFTQFYNSGTVEGGTGAAIVGIANANGTVPSFYIQNNGSLVAGDSGVAVSTGAGDDTLELTNLSVIDGIADLGDGDDRLVLDFNDDAPAGAVGQAISTVNVEGLSVDTGNWRAEGVQSQYGFVEIEEGATLTVVENGDGDLAIESDLVELDGVLNLDLSVDETEGDLGDTIIAGIGSLHLVGTATVELTDATGLQHTGGTFVENGELLLNTVYGGDIATSGQGVFELGAAGDFTGNLVNDGTFVFSRDSDYSFVGDFSGNGALVKDGNSRLTFAGLYAFEGTTSVLGGSVAFTGQLSEDTELDLTDGTVDLSQVEGGEQTIAELQGTGGTLQLGDTQLIIQQMDDTVFSGEILGLGALIKDGEGDLKLNGDGTGFTGTGQVDGGTLSVNGDFGNANFEVNEGGTLGGAGTVGDTNVNGGTLAPGNSIDTLTVNGDLSFTAASVYEVEVDAAGNADRIDATGTATLGGARVSVIAESGTYRPLTDYTILTAEEGISGTFGSVEANLAFLDPSLSYSANAVTLRLVRNDIDFAAFGGTANQVAVANLIESFGYGNALYNEALTLVDSDVAVSFASLSGEVYPAYGAALVETVEMLRRQTADAAQGEGAFAWATGLYNGVDSGSGAGNIELLGKGAAGGFGFGGGGFTATAGVGKLDQDRGGSQFSDGDVTFAIGRLGWSGPSGLAVSAGAQFGWVDAQTRRQTTLGTINQAVTGEIEGDYVQLFGELAYRLPAGGSFVAEPFVGVSHVSLDLDGVTETGAPTALAIGAIDRDVTFADVGLRVSGDAGAGVRPFASAAYRHAWGDRASVSSFGFAGLAGTGLVGAVPIAKSAAEVSGGVAVTRGMIDFEVGYDATISKGFDSHGVSAGFRLRF